MIPITSPEILGKALRKHRKDRKLTQTQLGNKYNLTQKTISQIESGLPGVQLSTLFKVLAALKLEIHLQDRTSDSSHEELWQ